MSEIGRSVGRIDALAKVTGAAAYPGDIDLPGQAHMKILFAGRPHAVVRRLEVSAAEAMPGVLAVLTARDVPVNEYGLGLPDQPVLCGPGASKPYTDRVRFVGDQVAVVVAENEALAAAALARIEVVFEDLPVVTDPIQAMAQGAVLLHPERESNVFTRYRIRKGDAAEAMKRAEVVVESDYSTPAQEHAYLQPEAGLAYIDEEDRITVIVAGQWTHTDQNQIAHALGIPPEKVRVIYPAIGGAFGGREDMSVQIVLALAVWRLHQRGVDRPVKIVWSRNESILGHHKRHPYRIHARWGASREGKLIAAEVDIVADGGAYIYTSPKVLGNATLLSTGPYDIPHVRVDSAAVYTNNLPGGAFRGFGGPQAAFAAESQMNKLAEALGMDAVELRLKNVLRDGVAMSVGTPLPPGVSLDKVIESCAATSGWNQTRRGWARSGGLGRTAGSHLRRGIGFACGFKNIGFSFGFPERCNATIELHGASEIERVVLHHSGAEVGQGSHTVMAQMAAEAVGVQVERVEMLASDTATSDDAGSASASRMTFMAGNAIRGAAQAALERWRQEERPAVGRFNYHPPKTTPFDHDTGHAEPNFAYGYVAETATVEVDTETGEIRVLDVVCADDVGKAINPQQIEGQIEGAVVQAAGYALLEDFQQKGGYVQTGHLSTYLIPTILDVPEQVRSVILEFPDRIGPWGARGMAEMPYLPLAPAITAAVHAAVGLWMDEFPLLPERVVAALQKAGLRD